MDLDGSISEEEEAAFIADADGNLVDGVVVADLDGNGEMDAGEVSDTMEDDGDEVQDDSIHCFEGHKQSVFGVAWSPKGDGSVCSGSQDDSAACWKVALDVNAIDMMETQWLRGHEDSVVHVAYSVNGDFLATGAMDGLVKIWPTPDHKLLHTLEGPRDEIEWIDWHPKGNIVVAGSSDFSSWMWNAQTGVCMQVFTSHKGPVTCGGFTPDGRLVVTGGGDPDPSIKVFDPKTGNCMSTTEGHGFHEAGLTCVCFLADSSVALTGSTDTTARVTNLQNGKAVGTLQGHTESVETVALAERDISLVLTGSLDGKMIAWDQRSLSKRQTFQHPEGVTIAKIVPQSNCCVTGSTDGIVRVWDFRTSQCLQELHGFSSEVLCMDISPSGKHVMAGSDDGTVRVFEIEPDN